MLSRYNVYHVHHFSLACWHTNICQLAQSTKMRLMGMPLVSQMFGHKPKYWTTRNFDLMVALEEKSVEVIQLMYLSLEKLNLTVN